MPENGPGIGPTTRQGPRVVIVGGGVGGLTAAVDLARLGASVTLLVRAAAPGGKLRQIAVNGGLIDAGPTVMTMRWVFDGLFADAGAALDARLSYTPLSVLARHHWRDGETLDLFADLERSIDAIGAFAGAAEARAYRAFAAEARRVFAILRGPFLESPRPSPLTLTRRIGWSRFADMLALRPFETLWSALSRRFQDTRLRQLFGRYATYGGSSPFAAPATLMLIAHVEQEGVWTLDGGMFALARALADVAIERGVDLRLNAHVTSIEVKNGQASGVRLASGEHVPADAVLLNADAAALADGTFGRACQSAASPVPARARSLSAVTWAVRAPARGLELARHNVFFSADYAAEFRALSRDRAMPEDPTIYLCAQDRFEPEKPDGLGPQRLLALINAPADGDLSPLSRSEIEACQTRLFQRLERHGLILASTPETQAITTPQDFNALFPSTGGALYGRATHGWAGAFQRPAARTALPGLFLAGGSAHPGAGVPMAALSGRIAASAIGRRLGLTSSSRRAATRGGILTPSATTVGTA